MFAFVVENASRTRDESSRVNIVGFARQRLMRLLGRFTQRFGVRESLRLSRKFSYLTGPRC